MNIIRNFFSRQEGASAAEFALVLPLAMLIFFGIIDSGRYLWEVNRAEKATQAGARFAVATELVPSDLAAYSFAVSGGIIQGTVVPRTAFNGISCSSNGTTVACACPAGAPCAFGETADPDAFRRIVARMRLFLATISEENVVVDYSWSGLGFSGDPITPDVAPIITISLKNMPFTPIIAAPFGGSVNLPNARYSLTMEDGQGTVSN
jgi:hypothetical protein